MFFFNESGKQGRNTLYHTVINQYYEHIQKFMDYNMILSSKILTILQKNTYRYHASMNVVSNLILYKLHMIKV